MKLNIKSLLSTIDDLKRNLASERQALQNAERVLNEQVNDNKHLTEQLFTANRTVRDLKQAVQQLGEVIAHI